MGVSTGSSRSPPTGTDRRDVLHLGQAPQTVATIDLTNPEAVAWFQQLLRRTLALGYDGWMHDFGEYVRRPRTFCRRAQRRRGAQPVPGALAKAAHDLLVARSARTTFCSSCAPATPARSSTCRRCGEAMPRRPSTRRRGSRRRCGRSQPRRCRGVPLWGSDMTGFKCLTDFPRDKEVYLRWAEFGAVSPIMMEQNACSNPVGGAAEVDALERRRRRSTSTAR